MVNAPRDRRGTVYVAVLGVTMIVAVMALAGMTVARLELRLAEDAKDLREARLLARSAVEFGVHWIDRTDRWRAELENNTEQAEQAIGNGTFTWKVVDADGSLTDDPTDNVTLTGYGRVGRCVVAKSVTLQPAEGAIDSLEFGLYANAGITLGPGFFLTGNTEVNSNGTVGFNGSIDAGASQAEINADAWATGTIVGAITGSSQPAQSPPRKLPGSDVFAYYVANGTPIELGVLPQVSGHPTLEKVVLSPASNPYGETNPEGIYVIDCEGQRFDMQGIRVVGTLVILNPGPGSRCRSVVRLENAVPNYPALLIDGDYNLTTGQIGALALGEWFWNLSFNPPGTPYEGEEETDDSDTLPATITGLVYVSGTATWTDHSQVDGCLLAGAVVVNATCELDANHVSTYLDYPPPGFRAGQAMEIMPGTWRLGSSP